jgi:phosphonate transport system substrate-binding protein
MGGHDLASQRLLCICCVLLLSAAAHSDECERGSLDVRYCDVNQDLVADVPVDQSQQLRPRALIFAYTPVEDPAVYRDVWSDFLEHLSEVTGLRSVFFPVQSNAAQIEAMRSGRLHVAGFNTGSTPLAVNCAGFTPFTMMAANDGSFGYEMEIVTYPNSGIHQISDLKGHTIAFSSPTSNSGFKAPTAILASEFGLLTERDYKSIFSGKHDNTLLGVINRDYVAGAMANTVRTRMIARGVVREDAVRVLYRSQTFPTTAFGHAHNLAPELAGKVREAFASFNWEGTNLLAEFSKSGEEQFIPISYMDNWNVIRDIDKANQVSYGCR